MTLEGISQLALEMISFNSRLINFFTNNYPEARVCLRVFLKNKTKKPSRDGGAVKRSVSF